MDAAVVVGPAALIPIAPRHLGPHPARVQIELGRFGPDLEVGDVRSRLRDHLLSRRRARGDHDRKLLGVLQVVVVELDDRLWRDRIRGDDREADLRAAGLGHARHRDAPVQPVVIEIDAVSIFLVDVVVTEIRRREKLEVVEVLVRQQRHPVARRRGERDRRREDRRQEPLQTQCRGHRFSPCGAGAIPSACADRSSRIGRAGRPG